MKQILLPKKIVCSKNLINGAALKVKKPLQVVLRRDEGWAEQNAVMKGKGYIVLDFGKEMCGSIRIITGEAPAQVRVRIRFGESLSETSSDIGVKGATNSHSARDFEVCLSLLGNVSFGDTGFRYVRLDFLDDAKVVLQNIYCENKIFSKKPIYKYNGQDKLVSKIFNTAKRTVDLCAGGEYVWDGVKRDRLVWIGDMHPEILALTTLYGRVKAVERSLNFVKEQTPSNLWMNGIPSYSMWWIICVVDYYKLTGAVDFVSSQLEYIKMLISRFDQFIDESGCYKFNYFFVDWPTEKSADREVGTRVINIYAVKKAVEIFREFGIDVSLAEQVLSKLTKKDIVVKEKKQVVALKYFALGEISDQEYQILISGGAKGMSTFMSYYILKAIAAKDIDLAISIMKEYYGAMLSLGATTFFEDFNIEWLENASRIDKMPKKGQEDIHGDRGDYCYKGFRHSLCHGWSSAVIKFIEEYKEKLI